MRTARELLEIVGFAGEPLDIALGVAFAESSGFTDAVGDYAIVTAKWGPSVGLFQVRTLKDPLGFSVADRVRDIEKLRDPVFQAYAAWVLSAKGTNWAPWSVFTSGSYLPHKGNDFALRTGHDEADRWNLQGYSIRDIDPLKAQLEATRAEVVLLQAKVAAAKAALA
jgi:hypothetical protein